MANDGIPAKILAQFLDVTLARVGQLAKEGVITKQPNGRYLNSAITQYIKYLRASKERHTNYSEEIEKEKLRQLKRENDIAENLVAPVEVLERALSKAVTIAIPICESLPLTMKRHFPELTGDQITLVKKAVAEMRNAFADATIRLDD